MSASEKVRILLAASPLEGGGAPFPPKPPSPFEGVGMGSEGAKRNIPKDFEYDPKSLKPLAKMMLSMSISLGHALTAYREFTRLKSATISPDGMLGGRGYVSKVQEVRAKIQRACEELSSVSDTIHDEINAAHWKPKMAQLPQEEQEDVTEFLEDSQKILDDPEAFGEKELDDIEKETDEERDERFHHPAPPQNKGFGLQMPGSGDAEVQAYKKQEAPHQKQASWGVPKLATAEERVASRFRKANSSLPVQTIPGGPRVQHLDRGDSDQTGPYGSYNTEETLPTGDDWSRDQGVGGEYNYPSDWDNNLSNRSADGSMQWGASATPSSQLDGTGTETEANDFGQGYGAKGKGSEGYANPSAEGKGTWGPAAGLPGSGVGTVTDGDSTSYVEQTHKTTYASYESSIVRPTPMANSELPNDELPPAARSDYYTGDKGGNQFNVALGEAGLPGQGPKAKDTPLTPRPKHLSEHMFAQDTLPGDGTDARTDHGADGAPNVDQRSEDQAVPYLNLDIDQHDQQDPYNYDRIPNA